MNSDTEDILKKIETELFCSNKKVQRFLLNCLSGTPIIGGVFSASAGAWSEQEQNNINTLLVEFSKITDERVITIEKSLADRTDPSHIVAGFITFNPNKSKFIDSSKISSLTDNGLLDFTINFTRPFNNYVFNYYGNGKVSLCEVEETEGGLRMVFDNPCPDKVTVVFFEAQGNT